MKDRLIELQRIRAKQPFEEGIWDNMELFPVDEKCEALVDVLNKVANVQDIIRHLESFVQNAKSLQGEIEISPVQPTKLKQKLNLLMGSITRLANQVRVNLRNIQPSSQEEFSIVGRVNTLHYRVMVQRFLEVVSDYNNAVDSHQQRCKKRIERQLNIMGKKSVSETHLNELLHKDIYIFNVQYEIGTQKKALTHVEERRAEILQLETSLTEVQNAFTDLRSLVENQGETVDSIEKQVCKTQDSVETVKVHLKKATEYKKKSKAKTLLSLPFQLAKRVRAFTI